MAAYDVNEREVHVYFTPNRVKLIIQLLTATGPGLNAL